MPARPCVTVPVPLMTPPTASAASLRLKVKAALSTTAPVPSWPVVPPLPTCSVPALIVVVPL